jgi:hypothetical protein
MVKAMAVKESSCRMAAYLTLPTDRGNRLRAFERIVRCNLAQI